MVIMSARCLLLSLAESELLERTHSVWLLLRPFLSLKSSLHLKCVSTFVRHIVLILQTKMGDYVVFFSFFFFNYSQGKRVQFVDNMRQHIDQTLWNWDAPRRVFCFAVIHTGAVSVIDLLRKTTERCSIGSLGICADALFWLEFPIRCAKHVRRGGDKTAYLLHRCSSSKGGISSPKAIFNISFPFWVVFRSRRNKCLLDVVTWRTNSLHYLLITPKANEGSLHFF